jgi:hypothetical protein
MAKKIGKWIWSIFWNLLIPLAVLLVLVGFLLRIQFNYNLISTITFGNRVAELIIAWIVGIIGGIGIFNLIHQRIKKLF